MSGLIDLLEFATKLSEFSDRLQQPREAKRKRIAEYLLQIENCLNKSIEELKNNQIPRRQWAELKTYAEKLEPTIGKEIGSEATKELYLLLMFTSRNLPTETDIQSIETAAGTFKALAHTITTKQREEDPLRRKFITYAPYAVAVLAGILVKDSFEKLQLSKFSSERFTKKSSSLKNSSADADQFPSISWEMHTFLSSSVRKTILFTAPEQVCDRVREMTQGRFNITLERTGETEEILKKVSSGDIQCGYSGIYYSTEKYRALFFGCAIPFGLTPQEQTAWLNYKRDPKDELTFMQSIYKEKLDLNVIPFPAGSTGGQMGGWFKSKIISLDDLKGEIIRIPGLGAEVWKALGMIPHSQLGTISVDEAIRRLRDGRFFAVEWTSPYDDLQLGLDKAAKFYYYPGWWEPSTTFDVQVNIDAWKKLPSNYQEIFKLACHETYTSLLAEYDQKNSAALEEISQKGIELLQFSDDLIKAAKEQTKELLDLYSRENGVFKEVYEEWRNFRERIRAWSDLTKIE
ncbi:MAG: hypothetical protein NW214_00665 [Pseudanabaenaceae cyanobacterium bins.39]|nr:hypothetical protein [Pseudanabaenaceae cyanobacterium bins.39]